MLHLLRLRSFWILLAIFLLRYCYCGWIDPETAENVSSIESFVTGDSHHLVFSDEFNVDGRRFDDGYDPKWTSIDKDDYTNYALHVYSSDVVHTENGYLNISTIVKDSTFDVKVGGKTKSVSKTYQSGMIQGWNKFCFTGGIVEVSAKLPGKAFTGGLWPALWLMGNLARATYVGSSNNVWPWSYDTCNRELQHQQFFSACNVYNHFDLNSFQGRGAAEIDILEAMPGQEKLVNTNIEKPYFSASLQVSPGNTKYRPYPAQEPDMSQWYNHDLAYGENTSLNVFFYGSHLDGVTREQSYFTDAISANRQINESFFSDFHTYRVEWVPGDDGYIAWHVDGQFIYSIHANALNESGAQLPVEPMYLIMNTAVSSTWGFPVPCPTDCACDCFDCRRAECLCGVPAGMCENLPADFLIDYVRVYQSDSDNTQIVGCSPTDFPTRKYIESHPQLYKADTDSEILRAVKNGGGRCSSDADCGPMEAMGVCVRRKCQCRSAQYTGPNCLAAAGFDDVVWENGEPTLGMLSALYIPSILTQLVFILLICLLVIVGVKYQQQQKALREQMRVRGPPAAVRSAGSSLRSLSNVSASDVAAWFTRNTSRNRYRSLNMDEKRDDNSKEVVELEMFSRSTSRDNFTITKELAHSDSRTQIKHMNSYQHT